MSNRGWVLVVSVVLSACGGTGVPSGSSDVSAFQQEITAATQALESYQRATGTMVSAEDCNAAVNGYAGPMQGDLERMISGSGGMDDHMRSRGEASHADVTCGAQGMHAELQHHLQSACHEDDMVRNREEAARHIAAMANGLQHMQMRAAEVSAGMGHMGSGDMDGGWRSWDGGTMSPDDHPMGCPDGPMMDGGPGPMMDGGPGPMMDGGPGPMMDGGPGPMMDGGMGHMP